MTCNPRIVKIRFSVSVAVDIISSDIYAPPKNSRPSPIKYKDTLRALGKSRIEEWRISAKHVSGS
jgi:hypothetical protein